LIITGDFTTQYIGDYKYSNRGIPFLTNQEKMELPFGILNSPILPMRSVRKLIREVKFDLEENDTASEEPRIAGGFTKS
jgi:hypothetical protein